MIKQINRYLFAGDDTINIKTLIDDQSPNFYSEEVSYSATTHWTDGIVKLTRSSPTDAFSLSWSSGGKNSVSDANVAMVMAMIYQDAYQILRRPRFAKTE